MLTHPLPSPSPTGLKGCLWLLALAGFFLPLIALGARLAGAPFALWFWDLPWLMTALAVYLITLGALWDGMLIALGALWWLHARASGPPLQGALLRYWRHSGYFSLGFWPLTLALLTALVVLGTSNITLISLTLLQGEMHWRDPFFWAIEAPLLTRLRELPIPVSALDALYHSAWAIESFVMFVLCVVCRDLRVIVKFCLSFALVFYAGRLLGLLNPVMGPLFYQPEYFTYLEGSYTQKAAEMVRGLIAAPPARSGNSGVLLGGISAMPSLHIAMVSLTAYWLSQGGRWTLALSLPWVLAVWASTVLLGWHYALDGLGGIALALTCAWAVERAGRKWLLRAL